MQMELESPQNQTKKRGQERSPPEIKQHKKKQNNIQAYFSPKQTPTKEATEQNQNEEMEDGSNIPKQHGSPPSNSEEEKGEESNSSSSSSSSESDSDSDSEDSMLDEYTEEERKQCQGNPSSLKLDLDKTEEHPEKEYDEYSESEEDNIPPEQQQYYEEGSFNEESEDDYQQAEHQEQLEESDLDNYNKLEEELSRDVTYEEQQNDNSSNPQGKSEDTTILPTEEERPDPFGVERDDANDHLPSPPSSKWTSSPEHKQTTPQTQNQRKVPTNSTNNDTAHRYSNLLT